MTPPTKTPRPRILAQRPALPRPEVTPTPYAFLLLCWLLSACAPDPDARPPWAGVTFTDPLTTSFTVRNDTKTARPLALSTEFVPELPPGAYPDSLGPGEVATVELDLHRPVDIFLRLGGHESLRPLLPGQDRILLLGERGLRNAGERADVYAYLDERLLPIRPVGRQPEATDDLGRYLDTLRQRYRDSIRRPTPPAPADWVTEFTEREAELLAAFDTYGLRGYYRFFYADTLALPVSLQSLADRLLADPAYADNLTLPSLLYVRAYHAGELRYPELGSARARNDRLITDYLADSLPPSPHRDDLIANYVLTEQADDRLYSGKPENLARLTALLPTDYRAQLLRNQPGPDADDGELLAILRAPLDNQRGERAVPLSNRGAPVTLYKFWFEGCYPCLVQQPHEAELLAKFPDLGLEYVAFKTARDRWQPYLDRHEPPTDHHWFVPVDWPLRSGAPTYVLVDREGEVRCRSCPKPSDPLLGRMIREALVDEQ